MKTNSPLKTLCMIAPLMMASSIFGQTLLLRYSFDEGSGSVAADSGIPPAANGTLVGGSSWTTNTPNNYSSGAYANNGTTGTAVNAGDPAKLNELGDFIISGWINLQANPRSPSGDRFVSKRDASGTNFFDVLLSDVQANGDFRFTFEMKPQSAIGGSSIVSELTNASNKWMFYAFVREGNTLTIYAGDDNPANGLSVIGSGTLTAGTPSIMDFSGKDFLVGSTQATTADRSPNAFFDDIRIYSGAGDAAFINSIRAQNIPEPSTLALLSGLGALILVVARRCRLGRR